MSGDEEFTINTARSCPTQLVLKNQELRLIMDSLDAEYSQFWKDVLEGTSISPYSSQLKSVAGQLSTDEDMVYIDGSRIVLQNSAIKKILSVLRISHARGNRTYEMAKKTLTFGLVC